MPVDATSPPSQANYPIVSAEIACRFTAIQLFSAVLWHTGSLDTASQEALRRVIGAIEWPPHLQSRLQQALQQPPAIDELDFNPHLTSEQIILLLSALLRMSAPIELVARWAQAYGFRQEDVHFVWTTLHQEGLLATESSPEQTFFNPPEGMDEVAQDLYGRLSLGASIHQPITHIAPHWYQHPWDEQALRQMKSVTGFETALRKFSEWHYEKIALVISQSNRVRVSREQFPQLFELWWECLRRAGLTHRPPDLYVEFGPPGAQTTGVEHQQVILSSSLVSLFTPAELMFVIGHELGHIHSEHVLYNMFAHFIPFMVQSAGQITFGLGSLLGKGVQLAVLDWQRKAEFTADRFGFLVCQDFDAAVGAFMKLAGAPPTYYRQLNFEAFIAQGYEYEADSSVHNKIYQLLTTLHQTHPWLTVRAAQLHRWLEQGHFQQLIDAGPRNFLSPAVAAPAPHQDSTTRPCSRCGLPNQPDDRFCGECGNPLAEESSVPCRDCGHGLHTSDRFCPECGGPAPRITSGAEQGVNLLFCTNCGNDDLHAGDQFCPECGMPL